MSGKAPQAPPMSAGDLSRGTIIGIEEDQKEDAKLGALLLDLQGLKGELPRIMPVKRGG